jgi:hypothetical protein
LDKYRAGDSVACGVVCQGILYFVFKLLTCPINYWSSDGFSMLLHGWIYVSYHQYKFNLILLIIPSLRMAKILNLNLFIFKKMLY